MALKLIAAVVVSVWTLSGPPDGARDAREQKPTSPTESLSASLGWVFETQERRQDWLCDADRLRCERYCGPRENCCSAQASPILALIGASPSAFSCAQEISLHSDCAFESFKKSCASSGVRLRPAVRHAAFIKSFNPSRQSRTVPSYPLVMSQRLSGEKPI